MAATANSLMRGNMGITPRMGAAGVQHGKLIEERLHSQCADQSSQEFGANCPNGGNPNLKAKTGVWAEAKGPTLRHKEVRKNIPMADRNAIAKARSSRHDEDRLYAAVAARDKSFD